MEITLYRFNLLLALQGRHNLYMPKKVSEGEKRVPLNCLVAPATRNTITRLRGNRSQGELVDDAIANLAKSPAVAPEELCRRLEVHAASVTGVRSHSLHSGTRPIEGCGECEKLK